MPESISAGLLVLAVFLPLAAAVLTWLVRGGLRDRVHWVSIAAVGVALACSLALVGHVAGLVTPIPEDFDAIGRPGVEGSTPLGTEQIVHLWTWAYLDEALLQGSALDPSQAAQVESEAKQSFPLLIDVALRIDPLTVTMLVIVHFISLMVLIYSIGYMHDDPGYARYFTFVSLFVFSMCLLVSASNFVLLYVGWEGVGVCSYLLIGFWYQRPAAAEAAKKAFLVNRIGDTALVAAIILIWLSFGSLNFHDNELVEGVFGQAHLSTSGAIQAPSVLVPIALLLLIGAAGKSAQFPLHVWLPDAMEGPTPISALIHAATMVTAGVYLLARCLPLVLVAEGASATVAVIGMVTALLAALMALAQNDLKRVLAYSTVSQLGFMFMALGAGSFFGGVAAIFHLLTHAFFKALLFLGAGSVMHAMSDIIDMRRFGGLRVRLPVTHICFAIGALALAGIPPLAGFFSKDEILAALYLNSELSQGATSLQFYGIGLYRIVFGVAIFTAFLTALYTARAFFLTFWGQEEIPQQAEKTAQESPRVMTVPMILLAVGTISVGWFGPSIERFLAGTPSLAWVEVKAHTLNRPLRQGAAEGDFTTAKVVDQEVRHAGERVHIQVGIVGTAVALLGLGIAAFFYLGDRAEIAWLGRVSPFQSLQQLLSNRFYLDEIFRGLIVGPVRLLGYIAAAFDYLIDGVATLAGTIPRWMSFLLRPTGAGLVQFYALAMILGLLVLVVASGMFTTQPIELPPPESTP